MEAIVGRVAAPLHSAGRDYEIIVVDDSFTDGDRRPRRGEAGNPRICCIRSRYADGFRFAVRAGLTGRGRRGRARERRGSDDPHDALRYLDFVDDRFDSVFGSRFLPGGAVHGDPPVKLFGNVCICARFGQRYDDTTNALQAYRRHWIENVQPLSPTTST
jgi:dolichol-phosphate mannosyltransferase